MTIADYLDPSASPQARPPREEMAVATRRLHDGIDAAIQSEGVPYLHPEGASVQTDLLSGHAMREWQHDKGDAVLGGERCWSDLPQIYARYGTEHGRRLISAVGELEDADAVVLTDSGVQATALLFDALLRPGDHVLMSRQVYNKSKALLAWLAERLELKAEILDDVSPAELERRATEGTRVVFAETYTNPLMRALDVDALSSAIVALRSDRCPRLRLVIDSTIATPWGLQRPLLQRDGVDFVVAAGTKALAGQDRDMWGYIAANDIDTMNTVMDVQAMRGGRLSWRAAHAIGCGLEEAKERMVRRCAGAAEVVAFLDGHPLVGEVFHPRATAYPDRRIVDEQYGLPGSLLSFRINGADEEAASHFCNVLAMTEVFRYALSFDGLVSKVNHHKTVSEYYTPTAVLQKQGIDRLVRLAIGVEEPADLIACLNWALWNAASISTEDVHSWARARQRAFGL